MKAWEELANENFEKEDEGLSPCELTDKYGFDFCSYCYCDHEVCAHDCPCWMCNESRKMLGEDEIKDD